MLKWFESVLRNGKKKKKNERKKSKITLLVNDIVKSLPECFSQINERKRRKFNFTKIF